MFRRKYIYIYFFFSVPIKNELNNGRKLNTN